MVRRGGPLWGWPSSNKLRSVCFLLGWVAVFASEGVKPQQIRRRLLDDAEKTYDGEMIMIPAEDSSASMTIAQRLIWQKNFQNARSSGMGLREAQDVALQGAVEGRVFEDFLEEDFDQQPDYSNRKVTCLACQFEIEHRSLLKEHYACDWHCVNVKRKSSGLAPITRDDFEKRREVLLDQEDEMRRQRMTEDARLVAEQTLAHAKKQSGKLASDIKKLLAEDDRASHARADLLLEKKTKADDIIEQQLKILNAMPPAPPQQSHPVQDAAHDGYSLKPARLQKKKAARQTSAAAEKRAAAEERRHKQFDATDVGIEEIRPIGDISHLRCPFCANMGADLEAAIEHLHTYHAFLPPFLPDLVDPSGLLEYLVRKVYLGNVCVDCGISYSSPTAVQAHMASKGHWKVKVDEDFEEAMGRFYCLLDGSSGGSEGEQPKEDDKGKTGEGEPALEAVMEGLDVGGEGWVGNDGGQPTSSDRRRRGETEASGKRREQEVAEVAKLRKELGLGQWAGARTVLKMAKKRGKGAQDSDCGRGERRRKDMEVLKKTMAKLQKQGLTRHGWRDASVGKAMMAAPAAARHSQSSHTAADEDRKASSSADQTSLLSTDAEALEQVGRGDAAEWKVVVGGEAKAGALWLVRRRDAGLVGAMSQQRQRKWEVKGAYRNYFTRKASLGKVPMTILNSGYRA